MVQTYERIVSEPQKLLFKELRAQQISLFVARSVSNCNMQQSELKQNISNMNKVTRKHKKNWLTITAFAFFACLVLVG